MAEQFASIKGHGPKKFPGVRLLKRLAIILALLYLAAIIVLYCTQRKLMYFPFGENPKILTTIAHQKGFTAWTNSHGAFMGWVRPGSNRSPAPPVLVFHGNGGSAVDRIFLADTLQRGQALDIYLVEYPGYGGRIGEPSQESIFAAAREALEAASSKGKVYLVGESLGTGVASYLAGAYASKVAGLFLIAPFNHFAAAASTHYPMFPTGWILKDTYKSDDFLKAYQGPLAVILAGRDEVVPNHLGRKLFDGYQGPKRLWVIESATHNSVSDLADPTWAEILGFLSSNNPSGK